MVHFAPLEEKYIKDVMAIYNRYVIDTTVSFDIVPADDDKMRSLTLHEESRYCSYVITEDNEIIGYVLLSPFIKKHACERTAEVSIYLQSRSTQKGIGKLALQFIEERAVENDFHTLIAVICTENEASLRLFEGQGYKTKGILSEVAYKFERYLDVAYLQKRL